MFRVGTKHLRCTLFAQTQVPAQLLRSFDSATGGSRSKPAGLFFNGRTILCLHGKIRNVNTSLDRKIGALFNGRTIHCATRYRITLDEFAC